MNTIQLSTTSCNALKEHDIKLQNVTADNLLTYLDKELNGYVKKGRLDNKDEFRNYLQGYLNAIYDFQHMGLEGMLDRLIVSLLVEMPSRFGDL